MLFRGNVLFLFEVDELKHRDYPVVKEFLRMKHAEKALRAQGIKDRIHWVRYIPNVSYSGASSSNNLMYTNIGGGSARAGPANRWSTTRETYTAMVSSHP